MLLDEKVTRAGGGITASPFRWLIANEMIDAIVPSSIGLPTEPKAPGMPVAMLRRTVTNTTCMPF